MGSKEILQRNSTMDIFKGLACIGVVLMHVAFPGTTGTFARALGCFGVPVFFVFLVIGFLQKKKLIPEMLAENLNILFI